MQGQYFYVYNNFEIIPENLLERIMLRYENVDMARFMTYQEILVFLDEKCLVYPYRRLPQDADDFDEEQDAKRQLKKANRNISREIFENCKNLKRDKASLRNFIEKYVEFLETAKLCLVREEAKKQVLENRLVQAEKRVRSKTFVFIKLVQATIHTRYGTSPCFQYQIAESKFPKVTVVNSLNPILNHEYILEMERSYFTLIFYESGVEIYKWKFDMKDFEEDGDGEHFQSISVEPLTFEVHVKLLPKNTSEEKTMLTQQLEQVDQKLIVSRNAFKKLCFYLPFQEPSSIEDPFEEYEHNASKRFTKSLFSLMPFLASHVKVLHYTLIALIFVECLASISWAVEFVDIIIGFYLIGILYDRSRLNISMNLWAGIFAIILSTLKTIWGALLEPFNVPKYPLLLVIAILMKLFVLFFMWICSIRADEIPQQRTTDLYGFVIDEPQKLKEEEHYIFRPNQNFYKNKKVDMKEHWNERKRQMEYEQKRG